MRKGLQKYLLMSCLLFSGPAFQVLGQSTDPSADYIKTVNSYLPGSPEAAQIMKYQNFPVDLFTGTPQISIPIYTLQGDGISLPINISYHAGGGVKTDEQATNIGLSWILNAGEITREVRGIADDNQGTGNGFFNKTQPMSYYLNKANNMSLADVQLWTDAQHGNIDLEPDIFYYSFGSFSGKFMYDDSTSSFVCITQKGRVLINFDIANSVWTITTDEGNKYIFDVKETSSSQTYSLNSLSNMISGSSAPQITSWKLSKIINAKGTDSITLNYVYNAYNYFTEGANISYQAIGGSNAPARPVLNSFSKNYITGISKLSSISNNNFTVSFTDDASNRLDIGSNQKALSQIIVTANNGNAVKDIFQLYHSYFSRPTLLGTIPGDAVSNCQYSLRLDSISEFGNSTSNPYPLTHAFTYNSTPLPTRLSFAKDFWGYFNNATTNDIHSMLAPPTNLVYANINTILDGANRTPDATKMQAGILQEIRLPTGGTVHFNYESNTVGYPIQEANVAPGQINYSGAQLIQFKDSMQQFQTSYDTTFVINQPANEVINYLQGGVIADIGIYPLNPNGNQTTYIDNTQPYFELEKIADTPNVCVACSTFPVHYQLQYNGMSNVSLPNGTYKMTAHTWPFNNANVLNSIRVFEFSVGYKTLPASLPQTNYIACGLRIKSIVSKDPYSNVFNTKSYKYHDPVTDSSYGRFVGTSLNNYIEHLQQNSGGQYFVRTGSYNIPGMGSAQSSIVYGRVLEEEQTDNIVYRTEHNYSVGNIFYPHYNDTWPFLPPIDIESLRGNEEFTRYKSFQSGSFVDAKTRQQVFNYNPTTFLDSTKVFSKNIYGIKCTSDSYDGASGVAAGGIPQNYPAEYVQPYYTSISRVYLASDTTVTYDLNSQAHGISQWHDYVYGDNNVLPMIIRTGNSDGSVSIQKNYYAMDQPDANTEVSNMPLSQLTAANMVSEPLGSMQYKDGELLSHSYFYGHFDGYNHYVNDSMRHALFSNPLDVEVKVLAYDSFANPLTVWLRGNKYRKYVWYAPKDLPLATCVSPQNDFFYFTSFEYPGDGGTAGTAFSGSNARNLSGNTLILTSATTLSNEDVYVWANGTPFLNGSAMSSTGKTKGSWTLYKGHITSGFLVTLSGLAMIDQLVVKPTGSQFQGIVYDAFNRIMATVNNQQETSFYEYDAFGRLSIITDEQGNILKSDAYQYQTAQ